MALIEQMLSRGDHAGAIAVITQATIPPSSDAELRKVVGFCTQAKSPGTAAAVLKSYLTVRPSSAVAHYLYAKLLSKMGDVHRAREHYNTAVALNSELEDEALATKLQDLGETMAHSLPQSEVGALLSLHKTGKIKPMPARDETSDQPLPEPETPDVEMSASPEQGTGSVSVTPVAEMPADTPAPVAQLTPPPGVTTLQPPSAEVPTPAADVPTYDEPAVTPEVSMDAPAEEYPADHHTRYIVVAEDGEMVKPMEKKSTVSSKLSSIIIAIIAHGVILFLLGLVVMNIPAPTPPEIVTRASAVLDEQDVQKQEVQKIVQRKPVQSAQAQMEVMTVNGASKFAMPDLDTDLTTFDPIGMGDSFGASLSFDAGEDGGMVSFFGARSVSKRVVFAVDYSASMRGEKDALMRKELAKSINSLPGGVEYQCIFFHGPAWYHGQTVDTTSPDKKDPYFHYIVKAERGRDEWRWYNGYDEKSRTKRGNKMNFYIFHPETGVDALDKLPKGEYISSTRSNIRKTIKIVEETPLGGGTDWRWPLYMAINMEPDTIFFMTDGAFRAKDGMLDDILDYNRKKGRAKINTICMMVPQAMGQLTYLADKSRGEVSLVLEDQSVLRGKELEDFLKSKKN